MDPLPVISRVITPMSVVIASYLPIDKAIYKGYNPIYNWACRWFFTPNSGKSLKIYRKVERKYQGMSPKHQGMSPMGFFLAQFKLGASTSF